jgi:hypothetical protein
MRTTWQAEISFFAGKAKIPVERKNSEATALASQDPAHPLESWKIE